MDLTLTDAWALWWSGQQLTDHTIYGISVLWASRIGKILAFLAGTTIVLDLIGSERLIEWGNKVGRSPLLALAMMALLIGAVIVLVEVVRPGEWILENYSIWALVLFMALISPAWWWALNRIPTFSMKLVMRFGRMLANPRFERWVRTIAVPMFFIGFGLDYLAS